MHVEHRMFRRHDLRNSHAPPSMIKIIKTSRRFRPQGNTNRNIRYTLNTKPPGCGKKKMRVSYLRFSETLVKTLFSLPKSNVSPQFNYIAKRYAGHSKWQNIMHTKASKDQSKSLLFLRLRSKIIAAVKEKGEDPKGNFTLRKLMDEAKKINMPNATLEKIIKGAKSAATEKPYWLFYTAPSGLMVGFEVTTPNSMTAISRINAVTKKANLKFEKNVNHLINEKGIIVSEPLKDVGDAYDKALEDGIDAGVEEVFESDDKTLIFQCQPNYVEGANIKLQKLGYNVISATTEIEFSNYITLTEEEMTVLSNLVDKLQNSFDELVRVVDNIER